MFCRLSGAQAYVDVVSPWRYASVRLLCVEKVILTMKIRASKRGLADLLFRARNFNAVESLRRFNAGPVAEASAVLKKAEALRSVTLSADIDLPLKDSCIFMPAHRRDGVGIQALVRICVMYLSQQMGTTYCHLPFLEIQHQFNDPLGWSMSQLEWAKKWEAFFNLGQDEYSISDLARQIGQPSLVNKMADENRQFGKPGTPLRLGLSTFLDQSVINNDHIQDINIFNLRFFRDTADFRLAFDTAFIEGLQKKFEGNGYSPNEWLFSEQHLDIAIHVRRGDIWESYQAGNQKWEQKIRVVSERYYVNLLQKLQSLSHLFSKPIRFHIFSDGKSTDFPQFTFVSEQEASLELVSGKRIENIQFHLSQNALDSLYHLANAPILVPSKSSFSFQAVLLGSSHVFYDDTICEFYQYDFLKDYMQYNSRFMLLNDVETQVGCLV